MQHPGRSLNAFIRRYFSYWPLFIIAIALSLTAAWLYLRYTIPKYESNATLLIKDQTKGTEDSKLFTSLDMFGSKKTVENEVEVLRSKTVMQEVVKNLHLYAPVYQESKPHTKLAYNISPVIIELKMPEYLVEKDKIYFNYYSNLRIVTVGEKKYPLNVWINSEWGVVRFIPNSHYKLSAKVQNLFFSLVTIKKMAGLFLEELQVIPVSKAASIVNLTLTDQDPQRGEDVLNELIRMYNAANIKNKNTVAANALSFVEKRIHFYVKELDSMEKAIQNFKVNKGIVNMSAQGKLYLGSVEATDERISDLDVKLAVLDQVESYIVARSGLQQLPLSNAIPEGSRELGSGSKSDNEELAKVRAQLQSIDNQIEKLPATPVVNSYKNLQIINLVGQNRALVRDSNNPEVKATIEANKRQIAELQQQVTSGADSIDIKSKRDELLGQKKELQAYFSSLVSRQNADKPIQERPSSSGTQGVLVPSLNRLDNGILSDLLKKLNDVEIQYERLRRTTAENSPILTSLRNQVERMKPDIIENIRTQRNNIEAEKANLTGTSGKFSSMLRTIPEKERELVEITRQQSVKNNIYNFLLQKREEAALSFAFAVEDSRLVDRAESYPNPVSPQKGLIYAIALIAGLGFVTAVVAVKEMLSPAIRSRDDIEEITSFPIIGDIAYADSKKALVTTAGEQTYIAEQFRQVRTSLLYQGTKKKLLVTSSIPGEGKSFIASNIAVSLSLTEKKVVLVELDLRKPKLGKIFQLTDNPGMSEYLQGKTGVEKVIQSTSINENLFVIPAGSIPDNPSELVLNIRLAELFSKLEKKFDYIVIETAPVNIVTDAYIISRHSDAILYVVRQGVTKKSDLKLMEESLRIRGLNNSVIIFNGVYPDAFSVPEYPYHSLS